MTAKHLLLFISLVATASSAAGAQPPTFQSGTAVVPIIATVTDKDGRLVAGLTAEDFEVLVDGRPQALTIFDNSVQPISVVLLLDTSGSMTLALDDLKAAAEQFVIRLFPQDQARVCVFNDRIRFSTKFTRDRDSLADSVRRIDFGNGTRLYDGLAVSLASLERVEGRKVIVVFTDGEDTASVTRRSKIIKRARADDLMVYAIGFATKYFDGDDWVETTPDRVLRTLAADTGGGYFELTRTRDFTSTFTSVLKELHSQYVLGVTPPAFDGRAHKISVRVNRANLTVRARRSFVAPEAGSFSR
jgi:Ca-activated chloride channel family protein